MNHSCLPVSGSCPVPERRSRDWHRAINHSQKFFEKFLLRFIARQTLGLRPKPEERSDEWSGVHGTAITMIQYPIPYTQHGFTLLEILITLVIFTFGAIVLMEALSKGLFVGGDSESVLVAANLCQEKIADIRNRTYATVSNEAKALVTDFPQFQRQVAVSTPIASLKQVTVTTYWYTQSNELNTSLITYVSDV